MDPSFISTGPRVVSRTAHPTMLTKPVGSSLAALLRHRPVRPYSARWIALAGTAFPVLLFGLRLWASVCLALYVAFWMQLDNPSWAGTSAAIVCQPHLGA